MARKRVSRVSRNAPFLPSKQAPASSPLGANFLPPFFCFGGYGWTVNHQGKKNLVTLDPNPHFYTHATFWQGMAQIQPPNHTLDPKLIYFYAEVLHLCVKKHWVTSDVQFRKGALIPPFWVALGWADWKCYNILINRRQLRLKICISNFVHMSDVSDRRRASKLPISLCQRAGSVGRRKEFRYSSTCVCEYLFAIVCGKI
jgi:hypothetical protein